MSGNVSALDDTQRRKLTVYRLVWMPSAVGLAASVLLFSRAEQVVEAVTEWTRYENSECGIALEGPADWELKQSSARGLGGSISLLRSQSTWIRASMDDAKLGPLIDMARATERSKSAFSSLADIPAQTPGVSMPSAPSATTVTEAIHEAAKGEVPGAAAADYRETPPEVTTIAGIEAAISDYTHTQSGPLGTISTIRGRRATIVGNAVGYVVVCQCPEPSWETLEPSFERAIRSFEVVKQQ